MLSMPISYISVKHIRTFADENTPTPWRDGRLERMRADKHTVNPPRANQVTGYTTTASITTALRALQ